MGDPTRVVGFTGTSNRMSTSCESVLPSPLCAYARYWYARPWTRFAESLQLVCPAGRVQALIGAQLVSPESARSTPNPTSFGELSTQLSAMPEAPVILARSEGGV